MIPKNTKEDSIASLFNEKRKATEPSFFYLAMLANVVDRKQKLSLVEKQASCFAECIKINMII